MQRQYFERIESYSLANINYFSSQQEQWQKDVVTLLELGSLPAYVYRQGQSGNI